MSKLRSLPYAYRVLFGCLIVALVPMLVGNTLVIRIFHSALQNQAIATAHRQIGEIEQRLDSVLADCAETTRSIAENPLVPRALIDSAKGLDADVNLALYQAGGSLLPGAVLSLYDAGGSRRFSTDRSLSYAMLPTRWGALRKAADAEGAIHHNIESFSGLASPFSLHTARGLYSGGFLVGYAVVSLPPSLFRSALAGLYPDAGELLVLDSYGGIVYNSRSSLPEPELALLRHRLLYGGENTLELEDFLFFLHRGETTGYYTVLRQAKPFTGGDIQLLQNVQLLMTLASIALCVLFSVLMSRSLSRPISRLSKAMDRVKQGNLDIQVETHRMDQLGQLALDFNNMAVELGQYMEKVVRQQREVDESQIRLLQAQLNPHFLYNTLDTVKWLAKINKIPEIASISTNLAIILRQCVSSEDFIPLRQELDTIRSYIDIQRIRFSGRFQYVVTVPDALLDCPIPKLILQPIVENAIIHGLADQEEGFVYIYAVRDEQDLLVSITDNGQGMPREALERLNQPDSRIVDGHLGLYNVSHIIKINYGPEYGLHASTIENVGTTVTVRIPMGKGELLL